MSKIKTYYEELVATLANTTNYDYDFLWDMFMDVMEDDGDIDYFVQVTLEQDW